MEGRFTGINMEGATIAVIVILILLIGGNAAMIGGSITFENSGFFCVLIILADIAIVVAIIYLVVKSSQAKAEKRDQTYVNDIINKFTLHYGLSGQSAQKINFDRELVNKEIYDCVSLFKKKNAALFTDLYKKQNEINKILECNGSTTASDKAKYLAQNEATLAKLKSECENIDKKINSRKIQLINEDADIGLLLKDAFCSFKESKKAVSETITMNNFVTEHNPSDLGLFKYQSEPITLLFKNIYCCLFSKAILVFDSNGTFVTAIDPSALEINISTMRDNVLIEERSALRHNYIASDSKCVNVGPTRIRWLHARQDGSRDMRYSVNYTISSHISTYEFVKVEFGFLDEKIEFIISSYEAGEKMKAAYEAYHRKCNTIGNAIPDLLRLLSYISRDAVDKDLIGQYSKNTSTKKYFCREVAVIS